MSRSGFWFVGMTGAEWTLWGRQAHFVGMHEIGTLPVHQQLSAIWDELDSGVRRGAHPFHTAALATIRGGDDRLFPVQRTVVLRAVDRADAAVTIHSDRRSPKIGDIDTYGSASLLFYDATGRWQLSVVGTARVHTDDGIAQRRWDASPDRSRQCYRTPLAPGTPVREAPSSGFAAPVSQDIEDPGRGAFAAIVLHVAVLEALFLDSAGHRRMRWDYRVPNPTGQEIAP